MKCSDFLSALEGSRVPFQGVHRSHHRFGVTSLIWWAVEWLREPLPLERGTFIQITSSPLKERDTGCSSHSPIKPSIELERSVISVTKRCLEKQVYGKKGRGRREEEKQKRSSRDRREKEMIKLKNHSSFLLGQTTENTQYLHSQAKRGVGLNKIFSWTNLIILSSSNGLSTVNSVNLSGVT